MNHSQHEVHSAQVAHEVHSPQVHAVQHAFTQQDSASETAAFCGAKLNKKKIAEKSMMDFIVSVFKFRITMLKNHNTNRAEQIVILNQKHLQKGLGGSQMNN